MKAMKKTLAILLCLAMCLSMLPTWAVAEAPAEVLAGAPAEATEPDAALMSEEPVAEVMQEPIPEETAEVPSEEQSEDASEETAEVPPEETPEDAPEEAVPQEEIPEAEEQAGEEPAPEIEPSSEPDAVSEESSGEDGGAGIDAIPVEEPSEIEPNTVTTPEEGGGAPSESGENPAETEIAADPAAEKPDAAEAVTVLFRITPENAELAVYTKDNPEHPEEKTVLDPEEDGSFRLIPGEYFYTLMAEGYVTVEEEPLLVVPSEEPVKIEAVMTPADEQTTEAQTEAEQEEAVLQAEEKPEETAVLMATSGTWGDNLTWNVDDQGTLTISGSGAMSTNSTPWYDLKKEILHAVIGNGVTNIRAYMFDGCNNLIDVSIPATVTSIGNGAFPGGCMSLSDVTYNGTNAQWSQIAIGSGNGALVMANIHYTGIVSLSGTCGDAAFWTLSTEGTLVISGSGAMTDYSAWLTTTFIGDVKRTVGSSSAPWNSNASRVREIIIEDGITTIGKGAFYNCCNMTSITIPDTVTAIGSSFVNCDNLADVNYSGSNAQWCQISINSENSSLMEATIHYAAVEELTGSCGDGLTWRLDDSGVLAISGNGEMNDYSASATAPWYTYSKDIKTVSIQAGASSVGNYAFYNCSGLENITIPETVTRIGRSAFYGCSSLTGVTIPDGLSAIEAYTFYHCSSLPEVTIPEGVTVIGQSAFCGCSSLPEVTIPEGVTSIGSSAFGNPNNGTFALVRVSLPSSLTSIENSAFYRCTSLSDVYYNGSNAEWNAVTVASSNDELLAATFHFTSVTELSGTCGTNLTWTLGVDGTLTISGSGRMTDFSSGTGGAPWKGNRAEIKKAVIEDGVEYIGDCAFDGCVKLASLQIPSSVTGIGWNVYRGCAKLTSAGPKGSNCAIEYGWTTEIPARALSCSYLSTAIIPEGITAIRENAFESAPLTSITIPSTVTTIGEYAFSGSKITSVTIPAGLTTYYCAFSGCEELTKVVVEEGATGISDEAFSWCEALTEVVIPESVIYIGAAAFSGTGITEITIPAGVTSIEDFTFQDCSRLTGVTIPASVTSIKDNAFQRCSALTDVYYDGTPEKWNSITVGTNNDPLMNATLHYGGYVASGTCGTGLSWILDRGGMLTVFGSGAMENYTEGTAPWYSKRDKIKTVILETEVANIGAYAFAGCSSVTEISIPESVQEVGNGAFYNCSQLGSAVIPATVTTVNPYTFYGCSSLKTITIPANVTTIGNSAFQGCTGLSGITIPANATTIGSSAFQGCTRLSRITIPANVTTIGNSAFQGCTGLSGITVPANVKTVGENAFRDCTGMQTLIISEGVTGIGAQAFSNCSALTSATIPESMTELADGLFADCSSLNQITIPTSVTNVCDSCFEGCTALNTVNYDGTKAQWDTITIGANNDALTNAALKCALLDTGSCGSGLTWTLSRNGVLTISGTGDMDSYSPDSPAPWDGLKDQISELEIGEGVTGIGACAFQSCTNLSKCTLPTSVTAIEDGAFTGCTGMRDVTYAGTDAQWSAIQIGGDSEGLDRADIVCAASQWLIGQSNDSFVSWRLYNDGELVIVGNGVMYDPIIYSSLRNYTSYVKKINIRYGVTNTSDRAFKDCINLTSIELASTVESIGPFAFSGCTALTEIVIPESVSRIGYNAFENCTGLAHVVIPATVLYPGIDTFKGCTQLKTAGPIGGNYNYEFGWTKTIPEKAFRGSDNLVSIVLPKDLETIEMDAFFECKQLSAITIPDSVTSIGIYAFYSCTALHELTLPPKLTSISKSLLSGCNNLTTLRLPAGIRSVENMAFSACDALTDIYFDGTEKQWNSISVSSTYNDAWWRATKHYAYAGLTYSANGGVNPPDYVVVKPGSMVILPGEAPTREGYDLIGWANTASATVPDYRPGAGYVVSAESTLYAVWQIGTFNVSYDANGGSGAPAGQTKTWGETLTLAETAPTREGYRFLGWAADSAATTAEYQPGGEYTSDADVTLYAVWQANTYTVHYDANGGDGAPEDQSKTWNEALTLSETEPSREGYLFLGWSTEQDGGQAEYMPGDEYIQNQALTLYAVWKIRTYTVRYNSNGGSGATAMQLKTYNIDLILSETEPTREGYDFLGWGDSAEAEMPIYQPGELYRENAGITLYAVWQIKTYTVRYDANGGYNAPTQQTKTWGESLVLSSESPAKTDFLFMGWTTDPETAAVEYEPGAEYTTEADLTLYAVWKPEAKSVEIWCYFTEEGTDENGNPTMVRNEACVNGQTFEGIDMSEIPVWTQLFVKVLPEGAEQTVTWSAEPAGNATVNTDGQISFLKPGIVTVTAATTDGSEKSAWVSFEVVKTTRGESATGITWELKENSDGSADLRLSLKDPEGTGTIDEAPWLEYAEEITSAEIPIGVMLIGGGAFHGCTSLQTILIPSSVEEIGVDAFGGCEKLMTIEYIGTETAWDSTDIAAGNEALTKDKLVYQSCEDLGLEHIHGEAVRENEIPATKETEGSYEEIVFCNVCRHELSRKKVVIPRLPVNYVLNKTELELTPGKTEQLRVKDGDTGTAITTPGLFTWSSSDETIVTVENGKVTGVKSGAAVITVRTEDGHYEGKCFVQVEFQDVANEESYFYEPVYWAVDNGITTGRSDTSFDPYGYCTRGHIVLFLWRAMGKQEPKINNPFMDVSPDDSFYKAVLWAYEKGITTGQTATTFGPWKTCTRGQIVTFLWRAMGQPEPSTDNPFTDVKESDGFCKAVRWAVENGITTGRTPTTFDPWGTCTRGQAVTFLYRAMN